MLRNETSENETSCWHPGGPSMSRILARMFATVPPTPPPRRRKQKGIRPARHTAVALATDQCEIEIPSINRYHLYPSPCWQRVAGVAGKMITTLPLSLCLREGHLSVRATALLCVCCGVKIRFPTGRCPGYPRINRCDNLTQGAAIGAPIGGRANGHNNHRRGWE